MTLAVQFANWGDTHTNSAHNLLVRTGFMVPVNLKGQVMQSWKGARDTWQTALMTREVQGLVESKGSQKVWCPVQQQQQQPQGSILPAFHEKSLIQSLSHGQGSEFSSSQFINQAPRNHALFFCADCSNQNGVLRCACEDGYSWFPPSCLDPQKCYLHTAGSRQSCDCHLSDLTQSVNFCEKTSKPMRIPGGEPWAGASSNPTCDRRGTLALCPCVSLSPWAELVFAGRWKGRDDIPC